jgi:hypothetical protein
MVVVENLDNVGIDLGKLRVGIDAGHVLRSTYKMGVLKKVQKAQSRKKKTVEMHARKIKRTASAYTAIPILSGVIALHTGTKLVSESRRKIEKQKSGKMTKKIKIKQHADHLQHASFFFLQS